MPIAFGPMPGPRQKHDGSIQAHGRETFRTGIIKFKSSKTFLQGLFPTTKFSWQTPGTIAFCTWFCNTIDNMQWLGGSGYSFTGLYIHGVKYTLEDGTTREGSYLPILWENLADPVCCSHLQTSYAQLYHRRNHVHAQLTLLKTDCFRPRRTWHAKTLLRDRYSHSL